MRKGSLALAKKSPQKFDKLGGEYNYFVNLLFISSIEMLYAKLFEDYLQLSKEDKRGKLKNILNRLGDQYDFYAETM